MKKISSLIVFANKLKWFTYESITSAFDAIAWFLKVPYRFGNIDLSLKVIVYVGEFLPPRIPRIAKWTDRVEKITSVLVCHKRGYYEKFTTPEINITVLFRNKWHLRRIVFFLPRPYIMHGFAPKSKFPYIAMQYLKKYHSGVPFIIDYQDVFALYYGVTSERRWLKEELPYEKECLRSSDGIIAHSLEPREGARLWGIKEKKQRLFFPLYTDNDCFISTPKSFPPGELHFVYAGGVMGSHRDKVHYGHVQFHWLIDYLTDQKIHFHIYPSPSVIKADYEEYEKIAKNNSNFHFHQSVSQADLNKELSKYHYGMMPFFIVNSGQSELKLKYSTTLKLFNYAEAGIPILVTADIEYQEWIVKRYGLGITVLKKEDFADIRKLINRTPYVEQVKSVLIGREKLSLKEHTPRLLKFYNSLIEPRR
ncbi:MAG TPA: hypothetical protein VK806_13540 [Bacteroidia bacterium]|jgi:hypothetical protein|nr:hypothetical protein [Bacteroidia bacterium]